jgi:hypothetical protein
MPRITVELTRDEAFGLYSMMLVCERSMNPPKDVRKIFGRCIKLVKEGLRSVMGEDPEFAEMIQREDKSWTQRLKFW